MTEPQVTSPIDPREMTRFVTDSGEIHVIHEMTLGDLVIMLALAAILLFLVIDRVVRR
ncbi:hypothetical protein MUN88_14180 [Gracilibacillus caseinilyticus]|uniref:Uncharacterized protein n=1 Tax=Gracilibacillus caseinilyticus TaxID=2932256 RepID=A0ABY4ES08_9BACI|nr:hypothetical protein [Gracilibacillus caseinilyticus]UOQ47215.1 hypothetical protein MUN88_14180 [Gracilibacillus caseinilyticus]